MTETQHTKDTCPKCGEEPSFVGYDPLYDLGAAPMGDSEWTCPKCGTHCNVNVQYDSKSGLQWTITSDHIT